MADEQKPDNKKGSDSTKTSETKVLPDSETNNARNALFIVISLLVIVFLIGLALIINRGINPDNNSNNTANDSGLVNSDTTVPDNSSPGTTNPNPDTSPKPTDSTTPTQDNSTPNADSSTTPQPSTNTPTPTPTDGSVLNGESTESSASANSSVLPSGHTEEGYKKALSTQTEINLAGYWIPTQYIAGDIPANNGKYTVQYGDTLWWIAAGHYGDPFKWTTIEGANYAQIGFLPDGEHALIFPDQVLLIP